MGDDRHSMPAPWPARRSSASSSTSARRWPPSSAAGRLSTGCSSTSSTAPRPRPSLLAHALCRRRTTMTARSSGRRPANGCASAAPSTSGRTASWSRGSTRPTQVREAVGYLRYPPAGGRGRGAPDPRRRAGLARPRPGRARSTSGSLGIIQIESREGGRRRRPRSPPSTASTSSSSARPTCRTRWASRASSTTRPISTRSTRSSRPASGTARRPGSCSTTRPCVARHVELGFRFIGLGSDGSFVGERARRPCSRPAAPAAADRHSSATRTSGIGAPGRARPGLGDHARPTMISAPPTSWTGVRAIPKSRAASDDRLERLDRADERGLRGADPPGARRRRSGSR